MPVTLRAVEDTSYIGHKTLALFDEAGKRLPTASVSITGADKTGIITVSAQFDVDGERVRIE